MYTPILVNGGGELIADGGKLVKKLEERHFPISAAFFRYPDEEHLPQLVIVSPLVGQDGPLKVYGEVNKAVDELGSEVHFGMNDIDVMSPSWSEFRDLSAALTRSGVEFNANGMAVGNYFLYRWNPAA